MDVVNGVMMTWAVDCTGLTCGRPKVGVLVCVLPPIPRWVLSGYRWVYGIRSLYDSWLRRATVVESVAVCCGCSIMLHFPRV